jgi:hypothetical protein
MNIMLLYYRNNNNNMVAPCSTRRTRHYHRGSRIFNMLNNALGVSLLAVSWVCSKAQEGQLTTAGIWIYLDDPKSYFH